MKIQIFADAFHGYLGDKTSSPIFGGQEILLLETCKLLLEQGNEVQVVQLSNINAKLTFEGIEIVKIKSPDLLLLQKFGFIKRWTWAGILFVKHIDKNADWIHLHNHHFSFPMTFFKSKKQVMTGMNHGVEWDVPWVYSVTSLKSLRDRFSFFLLKMVTNFSVKHLDKIITNDRFFIHFTTLFKPHLADKFKYIPNYYDERVFNKDIKLNIDNHLISDLISFRGNRKLVLLPKMSMRDRGTDILIEAVSKSSSWCLVITGVSSSQKEYVDYVLANNLKDKVFFTGHIDYKVTLPFVYKLSDIVVIPSPCREATAIALLEALAMCKPVISSEIGGLVEIIHDKYNGILVLPNAANFKEKIEYLLVNDETAKEYATNGCLTVQKRFNRSIWHENMINFFK